MYKVGDKLICITNRVYNNYTIQNLEIGRIYTVLSVKKSVGGFPYYKIDDFDGAYFEECSDYYNHFKLDVKCMRKEKLNKICLKSATN